MNEANLYSKPVNFLLLLCLLLAFPAAAQEATERPAPPPNVERIIVISLDGARPDAIQQANTPTLHRLAEEGAVDWEATTVNPSVTLPAHTSMLTGLSVEEHGVTFNDTPDGCPPIEPPTFVSLAADAGYKAAMVVGKEKFCIYRQREAVDYTFAIEGDRSVADRVIALLDDGYQVIFAHFPNPDYFGHSTGWMSETYLNELYSTDFQVGRIVDALEALNLLDTTLIMITADHGGHDTGHGTTMPEDMHIPWIVFGAGVRSGTILHDIYNADTAATALWALGLPLPDSEASRPVVEAFGWRYADGGILERCNDSAKRNGSS
jgi:predicted AlkP superfamily pyrophosphatase or phosphodiesterase